MSIDPEFNINLYDLADPDYLGDTIENKPVRDRGLRKSIRRYIKLFLEGMARGGLGNTYGVPTTSCEGLPIMPPLTEANRTIDPAVNEGRHRLGDTGDLAAILDREALFGLKGRERE